MGLTREQLHLKRQEEIIKHVEAHGEKISETMTYWGTYPVCVKDICVLGVMVKGKKTKKVLFGDYQNKKFKERKLAEEVDHLVLAEVLEDMKRIDNYYDNKAKFVEAKTSSKSTTKKKVATKNKK